MTSACPSTGFAGVWGLDACSVSSLNSAFSSFFSGSASDLASSAFGVSAVSSFCSTGASSFFSSSTFPGSADSGFCSSEGFGVSVFSASGLKNEITYS